MFNDIVLKIPLITGFLIWIFLAIYLLFDMKKKLRLLAVSNGITVVLECTNCKNTAKYTYSEYMEIAKYPQNKLQNFSTTRNQYLFNCKTCERKNYQELLYEVIPENSNFTKARRKIILFLLLKEYALGFIIME